MREQKIETPKLDMEAVCEQFKEWRNTRKRGSKIPEGLWKAAVNLSETHSINEISQSLRLEYNHLKRRVERNQALPEDTNPFTAGANGFIELNVSPMMAGSECVIEMERADGAKMRMSLKGVMDSQLVAMAKAFWSAQ